MNASASHCIAAAIPCILLCIKINSNSYDNRRILMNEKTENRNKPTNCKEVRNRNNDQKTKTIDIFKSKITQREKWKKE